MTRDEVTAAIGTASERLADAVDAYVLAQDLSAHAAAQWRSGGCLVDAPEWKALLEAEKMAAARRADLGLTAKAPARAAGRPVGAASAADRVAKVAKVTKLRAVGG